MIGLPRGEFEGGGNIRILKTGIVGEALGATSPGGQELKHVTNPDAKASDRGSSSAFSCIDSDSMEFAHRRTALAAISIRHNVPGAGCKPSNP
jgi:hypothetical protein